MPYSDPAKNRACSRAWAARNPESPRAHKRKYRKGEKYRTGYLIQLYGITQNDYKRMLAEQDGHCATCFTVPGKKSLHVDHNHATNVVRGLLCFNCNFAIGHLHDDASLARRIADYLDAKA